MQEGMAILLDGFTRGQAPSSTCMSASNWDIEEIDFAT